MAKQPTCDDLRAQHEKAMADVDRLAGELERAEDRAKAADGAVGFKAGMVKVRDLRDELQFAKARAERLRVEHNRLAADERRKRTAAARAEWDQERQALFAEADRICKKIDEWEAFQKTVLEDSTRARDLRERAKSVPPPEVYEPCDIEDPDPSPHLPRVARLEPAPVTTLGREVVDIEAARCAALRATQILDDVRNRKHGTDEERERSIRFAEQQADAASKLYDRAVVAARAAGERVAVPVAP